MSTEQGTRLRADAQRNLDQIIAAAKQVFLEQGTEPPMEEIARRAGVGIGTLYRRFPDREALIRAVARNNFGTLADEARAAIAEEETSWAALARLLERSRALRLSLRLSLHSPSVWHLIHDDPEIIRHRVVILELLDEIVRGAQSEGTLRPDVGTGDIAVLGSLLLRHGPGQDELLTRAVAVMLDGLRATPDTPLPGTPIGLQDLITSIHS